MNYGKDWLNNKWRPMMAVTYMVINICDFIMFPILWSLIQILGNMPTTHVLKQWEPITLSNGGLIHLAFGAILGISAWTRGQEKIVTLKNEKDAK